jgi:hypothetical protein
MSRPWKRPWAGLIRSTAGNSPPSIFQNRNPLVEEGILGAVASTSSIQTPNPQGSNEEFGRYTVTFSEFGLGLTKPTRIGTEPSGCSASPYVCPDPLTSRVSISKGCNFPSSAEGIRRLHAEAVLLQ